ADEAAGRFAAALAEATAQAEPAPAAPGPRQEAPVAGDAARALAAADGTTPASAAPAAEGSAPASAPFHAHLAAAIDSPSFAPALGAQVSVLVRDGIQAARLELNPAEMGPISVQIELAGTQAHVSFGADLAATRAALESSLPDLAAALSAGGFTLAGGGVFAGAGGQAGGTADGRRGDGGHGPQRPGDDLAPQATATPAQRAQRGVVDLVA
ncbi:flagellar hook-length control protein FliK, partial [Aquincola sp. MAHUQ-54]